MRALGFIPVRVANRRPDLIVLLTYSEVPVNQNAKLQNTPANGIDAAPAPRIERLLEWKLDETPEEILVAVSTVTGQAYEISFQEGDGEWELLVHPIEGSDGIFYADTVFKLMRRAEEYEIVGRAYKRANAAARELADAQREIGRWAPDHQRMPFQTL